MGGSCSKYGDSRAAYRVFGGEPERKRLLARPSHRLEGNIKPELQELGWGAWNGLIWLRIGTGGWRL
jgi:hypothetical protein